MHTIRVHLKIHFCPFCHILILEQVKASETSVLHILWCITAIPLQHFVNWRIFTLHALILPSMPHFYPPCTTSINISLSSCWLNFNIFAYLQVFAWFHQILINTNKLKRKRPTYVKNLHKCIHLRHQRHLDLQLEQLLFKMTHFALFKIL